MTKIISERKGKEIRIQYLIQNIGIFHSFFFAKSVGKKEKCTSPEGIDPQIFGVQAPILRHWVTENSVLNLAIAMFMNDMSLANY